MEIKVKHKHIEIEVSDRDIQDAKGLIYHNQTYTLQFLKEIVNQVKELIDKENETYKEDKQ